MAASVSVIIPSLNEEARIRRAIDSAFRSGAAEVIVADGGSTDGTVAAAAAAHARVISGETMRARQANRAAAEASSDILLFLHADTELPGNACAAVARAMATGAMFGGFRLAFSEPSPRLKFAAWMINARTALTRCPWGDQAQFVRRDEFLRGGGFREMPIMEDYELAVRMRKAGHSVLLRERVITSGRRFLERGLVRTSFTNWRIVFAYRRGVDAATLAEFYRGRRQ